jgi:hypothetical protein
MAVHHEKYQFNSVCHPFELSRVSVTFGLTAEYQIFVHEELLVVTKAIFVATKQKICIVLKCPAWRGFLSMQRFRWHTCQQVSMSLISFDELWVLVFFISLQIIAF